MAPGVINYDKMLDTTAKGSKGAYTFLNFKKFENNKIL